MGVARRNAVVKPASCGASWGAVGRCTHDPNGPACFDRLAVRGPVGYSGHVNDPHIHVEVNLFRDTANRKMLASTFGLVADLPTRVTTGCGEHVSLAMTSPHPRSVTCLPCREHAARWHTRAAEKAEEMGRLDGMAPGLPVDHTVTEAAAASAVRPRRRSRSARTACRT